MQQIGVIWSRIKHRQKKKKKNVTDCLGTRPQPQMQSIRGESALVKEVPLLAKMMVTQMTAGDCYADADAGGVADADDGDDVDEICCRPGSGRSLPM